MPDDDEPFATPPSSLPEAQQHAIDAADGWVLRVSDYRPQGTPRGVVIAGHAMMADARTVARPDRPCLAAQLVRQGFRVLVPDLRGHGASGPLAAEGGQWNYDDLVADVGCYVALARELEPQRPLALVGHSLFGHCALAWLGQHPDAPVRCVGLLAVEVWNRRHEARWGRWALKRALFISSLVIVGVVGYLPARRLRVGSNDESAGYWRQFDRMQQLDRWCDAAGGVDYDHGLRNIVCPVLHVASERDWLYANPRSSLRFSAGLPNRSPVVCGRSDAPASLARLRPTHMGMVTAAESAPVWRYLGRWMLGQMAEG